MFAALSAVEPPIVDREIVEYAERGKSWQSERMAMVNDRIHVRLNKLSARLGDSDWLDGAFSAADILMVHVLRRLEVPQPLRLHHPSRSAARVQARFRGQLAVFTGRRRPADKHPIWARCADRITPKLNRS
jgi:glutathione S-transferase